MHPNTILSFLVSAMALTHVHGFSGFSQSCSAESIDNSGGQIALVATCKRGSGVNRARLSLGQCYINQGGVVKFSKGGGFGASCGPASLEGTEATMHVGCSNGHGATVKNTVHLDLHIGNDNGNLVC